MPIEGRGRETADARIRLGMVGGGEGAFIGAVHRIAARIDDHYELVAGALVVRRRKRRKRSGQALGLAPERIYGDFENMAKAEAKRPDGIEAVAIVTPNDMHAPAAKAFLKAGIHVICDKPLTIDLEEALSLEKAVKQSGRIFVLTHNYTGYPMVRQARAMVAAGELGQMRVVQVEYPQDWLTEKIEDTGQKQAVWRTDPKRAGAGGCLGDIGTHAYNIASFVTGLELELAERRPHQLREGPQARRQRACHDALQGRRQRHAVGQPGRAGQREQPQAPRLRHEGRARMVAGASELADVVRRSTSPRRSCRAAAPGAGPAAARMTRVPPGHPEGYLEGFANIYSEVAAAIRAARSKKKADPAVLFPTVEDGVRGIAFIEAAVKSSAKDGKWTKV